MESMSNHFDLKVIQRGDIYVVSGKSAVALYEKLHHMPAATRTLEVGTLKNGGFTLRKLDHEHADAAPKIAAKG